MLDNNNLIILLALIFICFFVISNRTRQQNDYYENTPREPFDNKSKGIKFKATNPGYGKIVSVDDSGNLSSFEFPKGIIVAWSGDYSKIPDGWALCDGSNTTPDLRGRFILGANPNSFRNTNFMVNEIGNTGGKEKALLKHKHQYYQNASNDDDVSSPSGIDITYPNGGNQTRSLIFDRGERTGTSDSASYKAFPDTSETGDENSMPPYYSLAYIMKL